MVNGVGGAIIRLKFTLWKGNNLSLDIAGLGKGGRLKNGYFWQTSSMDNI